MKKIYVLIGIFLIFIVIITIIGSSIVTGNTDIDEVKDILTLQSNKEAYFNAYGYSIDNPNIIVNPYGNSPLTAIIMFETDDYSEVKVTIKSKNGDSSIKYKFNKDKYHIIPIYGLYSDYDNSVILESEGIKNTINIKTDKLPDDFVLIDDSEKGNFIFYNSNYPYAIDKEGEVRWYLNQHYYGNITMLDNSSFIIGSDRYNEVGNTVSFYKMNLLGKIYNEYLLDGSYYGYNALYEDNILVLSDRILEIDIQTGDIISEYAYNDEYDYLGVDGDNIIVHKDDIFYKINGNSLEKIDYQVLCNKHSFYNNTSNYKIVPYNRFGSLEETLISNEKISLIDYDKKDKIDNISLIREFDRLKVINNNEEKVYLILDKFLDKRIYEVISIKYINFTGLNGKYTIYFKINDSIYKTDYYIEV